MGIFDKKYCDLCGNPLGIIRNKRLSDGHCCDKCKNEFSSWIDKDYRFSVEDAKKHLELRRKNKEELSSFRYTKQIGDYTKVVVDESKQRFYIDLPDERLLSPMKDLISMFKGNYYEDRKLKYNFDIFQFNEVTACEIKIKEEKHEIKYKDKSSDSYHSFVPQAYAYSFDFCVILYLNHKYIDKIEFKLNEEEVDNDQELYINMESNGLFGVLKDALRPTLSYSGGVSNKKEVMDSSEYKKYLKYCREIEQLFSQSNNNKKKYSIISNICNCCGAMIEGRINESVRCEYCKNKQMIKYR